MKLRGGALSYALFAGVVTAILCFLMILLVQFNRQYFLRMDLREKVLDNSLSGIALGLSQRNPQSGWIDLFGDGGDSVQIKTAYWGLYKMVSCQAKAGPFSAVKSGLFGYYGQETEKLALLAAERNNTIKLAGSALIRGDARLPQKGLATAYIEGKNYSRDQRIYGNTLKSESLLPQIEESLLDYLHARFKQVGLEGDSLVALPFLEKVAHRGFDQPTLLAYERQKLRLSGALSGNMVIKASGEIIVEAGAKLNNLVLAAPSIRIAKGFKGALHLMASDSIVLEEGSVLQYPSSAVIVTERKDYLGKVVLKTGAEFNGVALYHSTHRQERNQASIQVGQGALVRGQLYSNQFVEHRGKLEGTLFTAGFILITPSAVYQDHLLDGEIDRTKGLANFGGLPFKSWQSKPELITWL